MVRKLFVSFKETGLEKSDCVCVLSFDDVRCGLEWPRSIIIPIAARERGMGELGWLGLG